MAIVIEDGGGKWERHCKEREKEEEVEGVELVEEAEEQLEVTDRCLTCLPDQLNWLLKN